MNILKCLGIIPSRDKFLHSNGNKDSRFNLKL